MLLETGEIVRNGVLQVCNVADGKNVETNELLRSTLDILASVCIFSILFSIHLLWHRQGEFAKQSRPAIISFILVSYVFDSAVILRRN